MLRKISVLLAFLVWSTCLFSQNRDTSAIIMDDQIVFKDYFNTLYKKNPKLKESYEQAEKKLADEKKAFLARKTKQISKDKTSTKKYIIPVVVHIIHNNGDENVSDAKVYEAIDDINRDFNLNNRDRASLLPEFKDREANVGIEFRLAQIDPNGKPTTGITRTQDPQTELVNEAHPEVKIKTAWPRNKYFNIWVVRNATAYNNSGYSFLPSQVADPESSKLDGVVMAWWAFGRTRSGFYYILTHEIGHWLSLRHTWGPDAPLGSTQACSDDDGIEDTPNTRGFSGECFDNGYYYSCGELSMIQNFMDYSKCTCAFTEGQKNAMLTALESSVAQRNSLWSDANLAQTLFLTPKPRVMPEDGTVTESSDNDGSISEKASFDLIDEKLAVATGDLVANTHYTIEGVPAGLTAKVTATSETNFDVSFTGNATEHNTSNSSTVKITILPAMLKSNSVSNMYKSSINVRCNFKNPYGIVVKQQTEYYDKSEGGNSITNGGGKLSFSTGRYIDGYLRFDPWGDRVMCSSERNVTLLNEGDLIGPSSQWGTYGSNSEPENDRPYYITSNSYNAWKGKTGYLGWEFWGEDNEARYCWIRIVVADDGQSFRITATGFSEKPGDPIHAGEGDGKKSLAINNTMFKEIVDNDGTYTDKTQFEILGAKFSKSSGSLVSGTDYTVTGLPDGLTLDLKLLNEFTVEGKLLGSATHNEIVDSAKIFVQFRDAAFTGATTSELNKSLFLLKTRNLNEYKMIYVDFDDVLLNSSHKSHPFQLKDQDLGYSTLAYRDGIFYFDSGGDNFIMDGQSDNLKLLKKGYLISKPDSWKNQSAGGFSFNGIGYTDWLNENGYAAIEFTGNDGLKHYAWYGIQVSADGKSLIFKDYCFNERPNSPIIAGMKTYTSMVQFSDTAMYENIVNDGSIASKLTANLILSKFTKTGDLTAGTDFTANNIPAGLTLNIKVLDQTHAEITFSGNAIHHAKSDSTEINFHFANGIINTNGTTLYSSDFKVAVKFVDSNIHYRNVRDFLISTSEKKYISFEYGDLSFYSGSVGSNGELYFHTGSDDIICHDGSKNIKLLPKGYSIGGQGNSDNWVKENEKTIIYSNNYGDWAGKTGYLGLIVYRDDQAHYAWVRISVSADNKSYVINDFGINAIPDQPIIAGQTPEGNKDIVSTNDWNPEAKSNTGIVNFTTTVRMMNGSFAKTGLLANTTDYTALNIPTGCTLKINVTDSKTAALTLKGRADEHAKANSAKLTIQLSNDVVTGADNNKVEIYNDFLDPYKIVYIPVNSEAYMGNRVTFGDANFNDYMYCAEFNKGMTFMTWGDREVTCLDGTRNVKPFAVGDLIQGGSFNWVNTDVGKEPIYTWKKEYDVLKGKTVYLGIRKLINGNYYYGWVQEQISDDGKSAVVIDMAYNTEPDGPIFAGEKVYTIKAPRPEFISDRTKVFAGDKINFTETIMGLPESFVWQFEGASPVTGNTSDIEVTYPTSGKYAVKLLAINKAGSTEIVKEKYITVYSAEKPNADFEASSLVVAKNGTLKFFDQSTNLPTTWNWEFEGGTPSTSNKQNPDVTYNSAGQYKVKFTSTNSYGTGVIEKVKYITVIENNSTYCSVENTYYTTDATYIKNVTFAGINNNSGDEGSYGNYTSQTAYVKKGQVYPFSMNANNNWWGPISTAVWIDWNQDGDFDEANETILYHTEDNSNLYNANVTVPADAKAGLTRMRVRSTYMPSVEKCGSYNGGGDVEDYSVMVDNLNADFTANKVTIAKGESVSFTDISTHNPNSWKWIFVGGDKIFSEERNPVITYNNPGTYTVKLTVSNGSETETTEKTAYITVITNDAPIADFKIDNRVVFANGVVKFSDISLNNPTSWEWTFSGGTPSTSTAQNPTITYAAAGTYDVSLKVTNANGNNTLVKTGLISVNGNTGYCAAANTRLDDAEFIKNVKFAGIDNNSGNEASASNSTGYGDYTNVFGRVEKGQTYPFSMTVEHDYWGPVSEGVWIDWNQDGTFDDSERVLYDVNTSSNTYAVNVTVPNDAVSGITRMRVRTDYYADPLLPCGTVDNGDVEDYSIIVNPIRANFSASVTSVTVGNSVNFTNLSQNSPTSYQWNFVGGTPSTSTDQNPSITYNTKGTYAVSLTIKNVYSEDTKQILGYITVTDPVLPASFFTADKTKVLEGEQVTFTDNSLNAPTSWEWTLTGGTPATSTEQNPTVTYSTSGTYSVSLKASNANGNNTFTRTDYIVVEARPIIVKPNVDFVSNAQNIKVTDKVYFTDLSTNNPTSWAWTFEGASPSTSTNKNPVVTYANPGSYKVTLSATNAGGTNTLEKSGYINVTAPDMPVADFSANKTTIVQKQYVTFTNLSTNADTYLWEFEGGVPANSEEKNPVVKFVDAGTHAVKLTVSSYYGSNTVTKAAYITATALPYPEVNFSANKTTVLVDEEVNFTDLTTNSPTSWEWKFVGANIASSNEQNPKVKYSTVGTYKVQLTAENSYGSKATIKVNYITVVIPTPVSNFEADKQVIATGNEVQFTDKSSNIVSSRLWTFEGGTPATSTLANPSVKYNTSGLYKVTLTTTNLAGSNTKEETNFIRVYNLPVADFSADAVSVVQGTSVRFTSGSTGENLSYSWTFEGGTPATSNERNPLVAYAQTGNYAVTLTVTNPVGNNTMAKSNYITVTNSTSITDNGLINLSIYPNPNNGKFKVNLDNNKDVVTVKVFDITGNIIYQRQALNSSAIDVNLNSASGVYVLQVITKNTVTTKQFIIK